MKKQLVIKVYDNLTKARYGLDAEKEKYSNPDYYRVTYLDLKLETDTEIIWFTDCSNPLKFSGVRPSIVWYDPNSRIGGEFINILNQRLIRNLEYHYLGENK